MSLVIIEVDNDEYADVVADAIMNANFPFPVNVEVDYDETDE